MKIFRILWYNTHCIFIMHKKTFKSNSFWLKIENKFSSASATSWFYPTVSYTVVLGLFSVFCISIMFKSAQSSLIVHFLKSQQKIKYPICQISLVPMKNMIWVFSSPYWLNLFSMSCIHIPFKHLFLLKLITLITFQHREEIYIVQYDFLVFHLFI